MGQRLRKAMRSRGMTPRDLIEKTGISKAAIYFILDDTTTAAKIRAASVIAICGVLSVSMDWLTTGKGSMEIPETDPSDWSDVRAWSQSVSAGDGSEGDEYAEAHKLKFRRSSLRKKNLREQSIGVFYASGDSMEPRIHDGDAILFDERDTKPVDGCIYVILSGGHRFVKRALVLDQAVYFQSDNPNGDHSWRKPKRMDDRREPIEIVGRVRWIGSWED